MRNRGVILAPVVFFLFIIGGVLCAQAETISRGALFPDMRFKAALSPEERAYLGLSGKAAFSLKDIKGALFVVEVFSTYCTICPKDAPILNAVRSDIENDPALRGKAKVVAIAIGNTDAEISAFKKQYATSYPILADLHFALHKALGNPRVPFTMFVKRSARGNVIVDTHQGVLDSPDNILMKIRDILGGERKQQF